MYCCAPAVYLICVWVGSLEFLHSMTIDAICSHQVSAVGTTQRLQHDQALPLSVKGVLTRLGKGLDLGG